MAAGAVDPDQRWLLDCLSATLDNDRDVRAFAEVSLKQASLQPGFGTALAKVTVNKEISFGLRQLSAVLLKQFIKQHWQDDEEGFIEPVVSAEEKRMICQLLLPSLDDPHGKIRTAVGMAVASIASYDWPESWPELLPFLLKLISDKSNVNGVRGSLRCLSLLAGDLDDMLVPKLVPVLFPYLQTIIASPDLFENSLRGKALSVIHSCISVLGAMSGVYKSEVRGMMMPILNPLMEQLYTILQTPVQIDDPDDWNLRMEALKCILQFIQINPNLTEAQFSVFAAPLWQTFVSSLEVYEQSSIKGKEDPHSGRYDSDGTERSLDALVIQLFEVLLTIIGNHRLAKVFGRSIKELVYYTIAFMQMTEEQVCTWSIDANQYIADEDDTTFSCRISGYVLLEEIVSVYGCEGMNFVIEAAQKRFIESSQSKVSGAVDWWKASLTHLTQLQEATLFAFMALSEQLVEAQISNRISDKVLSAAIHALTLDVFPPVKVGACRALSQLLPECNQEALQPHLTLLFSSLTNLLKQASDETLHLVLETLQAAVRGALPAIQREQLSLMEPALSPIILDVWLQHVSDPFITADVLDILEAIKTSPSCMWPLVSRILPSIGPVLTKPHMQGGGLVPGSLDLVTMILKGAPMDIVKAVFGVCFNPVIQILLESDDHSEMQNATECLAQFLSGGKRELLAWGGKPGFVMKRLLDAASRLLDPYLESSGSFFVGSYILQLVLQFPSEMSSHIRELVAAIVRRMQSSEIASLKSSLVVIVARLVHLSVPNVGQFIDLLLTIPAEGNENSLFYIASEWTKLQGEIQGAYQIKITTTALALLLSTRHVELAKINVRGHIIKSNSGITTRSKAKLDPDKWTIIPLPAKIFALLADCLVEIQVQSLDDDNEDSDWEEASHGVGGTDQDVSFSESIESRPSVEQLNAMGKVFSESEYGSEAYLYKDDPLNEINLANYLTNFFRELVNSDRSLFDQLCQSLTLEQTKAIEAALSM